MNTTLNFKLEFTVNCRKKMFVVKQQLCSRQVNGRQAKEAERDSKLSVSPSPSNASSNTSLTTPTTNTPPEVQYITVAVSAGRNMTFKKFFLLFFSHLVLQGVIPDAIPALNLTLQQVKELAHQKRSNKRAPPMDWTKKNELFSNL